MPESGGVLAASLPAYAELHCLTHFSFGCGASSPQELIHRAQALGYAALAIADECSVASAVRARQARADMVRDLPAGTQPLQLIHGSQFRFAGQGTLVALASDLRSWGDLCQFISQCRQGASKGGYALPLLPQALEALAACELLWAPERPAAGGLPPLPACLGARIGLLAELHLRFDDARWLQHLRRQAQARGHRLLAAGDVHMHSRSAKRLQDTITAIGLGRSLDACGTALQPNAERCLRSRDQLARIYPPELLAATLEVAGRCHFRLEELHYRYPQEAVLPGLTPTQTLAQHVREGAAWRFPDGVPANIQAFIDKELALIAECRYEMFFLTVYDIVREARRRGILCQGRGSAANSVVCYCLGITAADPRFSHPLLERFISRARRGEPPDIDVDFEHERREEIIQYIYARYGRERAALAATVISYRTRSALRAAGMALGVDARLVAAVARGHYSFEGKALEQGVAEAAQRLQLSPQPARVALWLELAQQLRGRPRHLSQHVGGFVLTQGPLLRLVPVEPARMASRSVIQWDKDDLEALGWLKVDILALGMLSAVRRCLDLVSNWRGRPFAREHITKEDAATYAMIQRADTVGVFQIESRAQMSMLPRLRPRTFYDLVVQVAIVRPGPITGGMVHPYLRARERQRRGLPVRYPRAAGEATDRPPRLAQALGRTLGVPIFQEQVMQLSMLAAGFSAAEADSLRRSMASWKKKGGLEPFRDKLLDGMRAAGYDEDFALRLFEQIKGFGDYGFPESHAYSFALIAYESAWLKCHEPEAFLAALLNSQPMGFYAPAQLVQDARRHDVVVLPPDVSTSDWDCTLEACVVAEVAEVAEVGGDVHGGALRAPASILTQRGRKDLLRSEELGPSAPSPSGGRPGWGPAQVQKMAGPASSVTQGPHLHPPPEGEEEEGDNPRGNQKPHPPSPSGGRLGWGPDRPQKEGKAAPSMAICFHSTPLPEEDEAGSSSHSHGASTRPAVRLGLRMVHGLPEAVALRIVGERGKRPFASVEDLAHRAGLDRRDLRRLAAADALRSLAGHRRQQLWQGAAMHGRAPLLQQAPIHEAALQLPAAPEGETIVQDYAALGLTLRRHPLVLLRPALSASGLRTAEQLRATPDGSRVRACGMVTGRQRPSTARGTIFVTLEDETGPVNVIVWNRVCADEDQLRILLRARLLQVHGIWQRGPVGAGHLIARYLVDRTPLLGRLAQSARSRDFH